MDRRGSPHWVYQSCQGQWGISPERLTRDRDCLKIDHERVKGRRYRHRNWCTDLVASSTDQGKRILAKIQVWQRLGVSDFEFICKQWDSFLWNRTGISFSNFPLSKSLSPLQSCLWQDYIIQGFTVWPYRFAHELVPVHPYCTFFLLLKPCTFQSILLQNTKSGEFLFKIILLTSKNLTHNSTLLIVFTSSGGARLSWSSWSPKAPHHRKSWA